MFRVNAREWINPKTVGIYHVEIEDENNMGDKVYCVRIETENDEYYLSQTVLRPAKKRKPSQRKSLTSLINKIGKKTAKPFLTPLNLFMQFNLFVGAVRATAVRVKGVD